MKYQYATAEREMKVEKQQSFKVIRASRLSELLARK